MTVNGETKLMRLDYEASSLHSVIADGQIRGTSAGKETWISLIAGSSLQRYCNNQGFNIDCFSTSGVKARLAFVANNAQNCRTCDSWIGFGVYYSGCSTIDYQACGNRAFCATERVVDIPAFGYLFVQ